MNLKSKLILAVMLVFNIALFAQSSRQLKGVVVSAADNIPIPGVNVILTNSSKGASTDFDGAFQLEVKEGDVLQVSYVGFVSQTIIVSNQKSLNIALQEDLAKLDEVVVIGYGTQKAKNLTSSVSKVAGELLEKSITPRIDDALRGRIAGVNIVSTTGEVGADTRITIRGTGSISGTSAPLIVVDGLPLGTDPDLLSSIDANNIKSIEVLKDASSTAIYGSRGANGVIIVTLKEGVSGDTKFSYNHYLGVRYAKKNNNFNLSISEEEARIDNLFANENLSGATQAQIDDFNSDYLNAKSELQAQKYVAAAGGGETDWQDLVFTGGVVSSHSFSARGGSDLSKFDASVSYIKDEGIYINDQFERYNARLKLTTQTKNKKIKYGLTINTRLTDQERLPTSFLDPIRQNSFIPTTFNEETLALINPYPNSSTSGVNTSNQVYPGTSIDYNNLSVGSIAFERAFDGVFQADGYGGIIVDANGNPVIDPGYNGLDISSTGNNGPLSFLELRSQNKEQFTGFASTFIEFKLLEGLKFKQSLSGNYRTTKNTRYQSYLSDNNLAAESLRQDQVTTRQQINLESLLTYKKDFGKNSINALAGFTFDEYNYTFRFLGVQGVFLDDFTENISIADTQNAPEAYTLLGKENLVSYFGRVVYDYDDKYLFSVSARTDASTRFGSKNRYGFFPTASIGWNLSNENFFNDIELISNLKVRASYGISGSNDIDSNIFESLYRSQALASTVSYGDFSGRKVTNLGDDTLAWEQLGELNLGLDFGVWNGLISGSVDFYNKKSEDLILDLQVPSVLGSNTQLQNIGQVENEGFELELTARVISTENLSWRLSGQFAANRNEVLSLGGAQSIVTASTDANRPVEWITEVGGPISAFYGYVADESGSIPAYEFTAGSGAFGRYDLESQNVIVVDINGDGIIDTDDRTVLGSPYPDFEWGLSSDLTFYDFDFGFALQGSHGAERRNGDIGSIRNSDFSSGQISASFLEENLTAPRNLTSDHIEDASFVALRNISLGYTLPRDVVDKLGLDRLRFYATGENLIYIFADGYRGFNPEAAGTSNGGTNTPITYGYQRGDGPVSRTVSIGVNLDF